VLQLKICHTKILSLLDQLEAVGGSSGTLLNYDTKFQANIHRGVAHMERQLCN
jgi:hypothetical protein